MTQQEASEKIAQLLKQVDANLAEAVRIAEEAKVEFVWQVPDDYNGKRTLTYVPHTERDWEDSGCSWDDSGCIQDQEPMGWVSSSHYC